MTTILQNNGKYQESIYFHLWPLFLLVFRLVSWFCWRCAFKKRYLFKKLQSNLIYMSSHQILLHSGRFWHTGIIGQIWSSKATHWSDTLVWRVEEFGSRLIDTTQWDSHPHDNFHLTLVWTQSLTIIITPGNQKTEHFLYIENYRFYLKYPIYILYGKFLLICFFVCFCSIKTSLKIIFKLWPLENSVNSKFDNNHHTLKQKKNFFYI